MTIGRDGTIAPGLARSWDIDSTGTTYTFHLDPGALASDGSKVGASVARASFERLLDPAHPSPRAWVLEGIEGATAYTRGEAKEVAGIRILDEATLEIRLARPKASFLGLLAMPNAAVTVSNGGADGAVSTGPWILTERVAGSRLRFARNPHWHGASPRFDEILVRILSEEFTRVAEFEVGHLDVLEIPASQAKRLKDDPKYAPRITRQVALVTDYIGLNHEDPVLRDSRVRRALNHAVHVDRILETILEGRGVRATGAVPPGIPGGGGGEPFAYDLDRAKALLAEANVPAEWTLQLWQRPNPIVSQVLEAVQADLRAVGVQAEILQRDWGALKAAIDRGETAAFYMNWYADYPDAENFLVPLFHSANIGGGGNRARLRDTRVDALLDRLESERDPDARAAMARAADSTIAAGAPWIYLWHPAQEVVTSERVTGWSPHPVPACERWIEIDRAAGTPR